MVTGLSGVQCGLYSYVWLTNAGVRFVYSRVWLQTEFNRRHEVLLPINRNFNKICDIWGSFFNQTQEIPRFFSLAVKKKAI